MILESDSKSTVETKETTENNSLNNDPIADIPVHESCTSCILSHNKTKGSLGNIFLDSTCTHCANRVKKSSCEYKPIAVEAVELAGPID